MIREERRWHRILAHVEGTKDRRKKIEIYYQGNYLLWIIRSRQGWWWRLVYNHDVDDDDNGGSGSSSSTGTIGWLCLASQILSPGCAQLSSPPRLHLVLPCSSSWTRSSVCVLLSARFLFTTTNAGSSACLFACWLVSHPPCFLCLRFIFEFGKSTWSQRANNFNENVLLEFSLHKRLSLEVSFITRWRQANGFTIGCRRSKKWVSQLGWWRVGDKNRQICIRKSLKPDMVDSRNAKRSCGRPALNARWSMLAKRSKCVVSCYFGRYLERHCYCKTLMVWRYLSDSCNQVELCWTNQVLDACLVLPPLNGAQTSAK